MTILAALIWMTTLSASTSCGPSACMFFVLGAGLGLIMQNVVLAAQNAVAAEQIGTATVDEQLLPRGRRHPRRRHLRDLFTSRLADNLVSALSASGHAQQAVQAGITSTRRRWCPPR